MYIHFLNFIFQPPASDWVSRTRSRSVISEHESRSDHESDWETTSDEDLTMDCPPEKNDVSKLTQIPLSRLATAKSIVWLAEIINFKHSNRNYERIMVCCI